MTALAVTVPKIDYAGLSPLFVIIVCQLLLILPVAWLEGAASRPFPLPHSIPFCP